jgi:hypothetical protein
MARIPDAAGHIQRRCLQYRHVPAAARDNRGAVQYKGIMGDAPVLGRAERFV